MAVGRTNVAIGKVWKYASGTIGFTDTTNADSPKTFTVSGLGFKPRMVVAVTGTNSTVTNCNDISVGMLDANDSVVVRTFLSTLNAKYGESGSIYMGDNGFTVTNDGFSMNIIQHLSDVTWRAWGY